MAAMLLGGFNRREPERITRAEYSKDDGEGEGFVKEPLANIDQGMEWYEGRGAEIRNKGTKRVRDLTAIGLIVKENALSNPTVTKQCNV